MTYDLYPHLVLASKQNEQKRTEKYREILLRLPQAHYRYTDLRISRNNKGGQIRKSQILRINPLSLIRKFPGVPVCKSQISKCFISSNCKFLRCASPLIKNPKILHHIPEMIKNLFLKVGPYRGKTTSKSGGLEFF